jgi:lantibiotic modifying enzyme
MSGKKQNIEPPESISQTRERFNKLSEYSFESMKMIHLPPYRSLYFGGSGVAYAYMRAACAFDDPEWLHQARFWIDHVEAAPQDSSVMEVQEHPEEDVKLEIGDSLFFGNPGVYFAKALVAKTLDNQEMLNQAVKDYIQPEHEITFQSEIMQGLAGQLMGCAALLEETGRKDLRDYGDHLFEDMLKTADGTKSAPSWREALHLGMAHGRAGNLYALLRWTEQTSRRLPEWVLEDLEHLRSMAITKGSGTTWPMLANKKDNTMDTWCNGAPGLIHLWCLAYKIYGHTEFLEAAREAGDYIIGQPAYFIGHLCCGAAGVCYAFIRLNRTDPSEKWVKQINRSAREAAGGSIDTNCRIGLYRGESGIACLMLDMHFPDFARQPVMEA